MPGRREGHGERTRAGKMGGERGGEDWVTWLFESKGGWTAWQLEGLRTNKSIESRTTREPTCPARRGLPGRPPAAPEPAGRFPPDALPARLSLAGDDCLELREHPAHADRGLPSSDNPSPALPSGVPSAHSDATPAGAYVLPTSPRPSRSSATLSSSRAHTSYCIYAKIVHNTTEEWRRVRNRNDRNGPAS